MQSPRTAPPRLTFAHGTLLLEGLGRGHAQPWMKMKSARWAWDPRVSAWRCDALGYAELRERLRAGVCLDDRVARWQHRLRWPRISLPPLRPEQCEAAAAWKRARRGVIVMPTGTGKTEVALEIIRAAAVSTLVVAPVRDLMYQWHRRIHDSLGYDAGILGDGVHRIAPLSVTTYDSACIHMERLGVTFALVVFDECHHLPGDVRRDAARMSAAPLRLGLTATPERSDGRHADLDWLIGPRVYELPLAAVRGNVLADYDVVRIPVRLSDREQSLYNSLRTRCGSTSCGAAGPIRISRGSGCLPKVAATRRYAGRRWPAGGKKPSKTGPRKSCAYWRTSSACMPAAPC